MSISAAAISETSETLINQQSAQSIYILTDLSITEPAQSLGTFGGNVSIGNCWIESKLIDQATISSLHDTSSSKKSGEIAFLSFTKGTPWPVNIGAHVGSIKDSSVKIVSGHIDLMLFEVPFWPSVGARINHKQVLGWDNVDYSHQSAQLSLAYGRGSLTGYAGAQINRGSLKISETTTDDQNSVDSQRFTRMEKTSFSIGGRLALFTGMTHITAEINHTPALHDVISFKLSYKL